MPKSQKMIWMPQGWSICLEKRKAGWVYHAKAHGINEFEPPTPFDSGEEAISAARKELRRRAYVSCTGIRTKSRCHVITPGQTITFCGTHVNKPTFQDSEPTICKKCGKILYSLEKETSAFYNHISSIAEA